MNKIDFYVQQLDVLRDCTAQAIFYQNFKPLHGYLNVYSRRQSYLIGRGLYRTSILYHWYAIDRASFEYFTDYTSVDLVREFNLYYYKVLINVSIMHESFISKKIFEVYEYMKRRGLVSRGLFDIKL